MAYKDQYAPDGYVDPSYYAQGQQQTQQKQTQQTNQGCATAQYLRSPEEIVDLIFKYHSPRPDQLPKYQAIREAAKYFAKVILTNTPNGADRSDAIRKIREAVMTANQSIALDGVI